MEKLDIPLKSTNPLSRFIIFFTKRSSNVSYFLGVITQAFPLVKKFAYKGHGKDALMKSCVQPQCFGRIGDLKGTSQRSDLLILLANTR